MDCHHCITESAERKKGQHLRMEDRGAIKVLKKQGLGPRAIARQIGCAPSTVTNELRRGTPARKSNKGKAPGYSPTLGEAVYRANRVSCHRHPKAGVCSNFTSWVVRQIREHKWSLDACCGYAKRHSLFEPSEMVCSRTLYNMVWKGHLSICLLYTSSQLYRMRQQLPWGNRLHRTWFCPRKTQQQLCTGYFSGSQLSGAHVSACCNRRIHA